MSAILNMFLDFPDLVQWQSTWDKIANPNFQFWTTLTMFIVYILGISHAGPKYNILPLHYYIHRWTIRIVLYWNTIPKAGIVLVLVDFSKLSNTNTKSIPRNFLQHSVSFNRWLIQKTLKTTCFLWLHSNELNFFSIQSFP